MKIRTQQLFMCVAFIILIFLPNNLLAENISMTALGEYIMGDNDTYTEAKKLALQDAKRILLEKVGTYIESKTEVKDGIVKIDEIKQYTAGIIKVEEIGDERSILANKATVVKVSIKAIVDPDALIKQVISFRNQKNIEESAKKLSIDNNKLRKEIEELNQQLRNIVDEKKYQQLNIQRKEILEQIDTNEKGLTLLLSGEKLHTAALLDRQEKNDTKTIVTKLIKEIASSYELSASPIEVNDNGDGTAKVTFKVKATIPFSFNFPYGVNLDAIKPTGLKFSKKYGSLCIECNDKKCFEAIDFMTSELKAFVLSVELGRYKNIEKLSPYPNMCQTLRRQRLEFNPTFKADFSKEYEITMPLYELKSLSQLKLRILYASEEYGK